MILTYTNSLGYNSGSPRYFSDSNLYSQFNNKSHIFINNTTKKPDGFAFSGVGGNILTVGPGNALICGVHVEITTNETLSIPPTYSGPVYLSLDKTGIVDETTNTQCYLSITTTPKYEDINNGGLRYDLLLGNVISLTGVISSLDNTTGYNNSIINYYGNKNIIYRKRVQYNLYTNGPMNNFDLYRTGNNVYMLSDSFNLHGPKGYYYMSTVRLPIGFNPGFGKGAYCMSVSLSNTNTSNADNCYSEIDILPTEMTNYTVVLKKFGTGWTSAKVISAKFNGNWITDEPIDNIEYDEIIVI